MAKSKFDDFHVFRIVGKRAGLAVMLYASASALAYAQPLAESDAESNSPAESQQTVEAEGAADETRSLSTVVVTAQRREQRLVDVPISVQTKTGEELTAAGVVDGRAIEQISPALNFRSGYSSGSTSLSIRGVSSQASEGGLQPSVGVVMDGVPLARQGEVLLNLADVDRVEVLSGPQGTLFGKNSTAGVVNIISKRPVDEFETSLELTATDDDEQLVRGVVNLPLGDNVAARINAYYNKIEPLGSNLAGHDVLGLEAHGVSGKLLFDVGDKTDVLLTALYNRNYNSFGVNFVSIPLAGALGDAQIQYDPSPAVFSIDNLDGDPIVNQDVPSYQRTKQHAFVAEVNSELSDTLSLVSLTGYRKYQYNAEIDVDATPFGGMVGQGVTSPVVGPLPSQYPIGWYGYGDQHEGNTYEYWSQEVRLNYSNGALNALAGVYYQDYKETRFLRNPFIFDGTFAPGDPSLAGVLFMNLTHTNPKIDDTTYAFFGDVTYDLSPAVAIFGGLRYTHEEIGLDYWRQVYFTPIGAGFDPLTGEVTAAPIASLEFSKDDSKREEDAVTGRIGIQWRPDDTSNYYFSFNRGYKGPAVNQTTGVLDAMSAIVAPEFATAYELGVKKRFFDDALAVDFAVYSQTIEDVQQASIRPGTIIPDLVNAGDLKTEGFELNMTALPTEGLTLNLGVVYNDATYDGGVVFNCGPTQNTNNTCPDNPSAGFQIIDGQQAISTPKWKVVSSLNYERPVAEDYELGFRVGYNWWDEIQHTLFIDPLTLAPSRGSLDASVTFGREDDSWNVTVFGKNLTDDFYFNNLNTVSVIGQQFGNVGRDFHRYYGVRLTLKN